MRDVSLPRVGDPGRGEVAVQGLFALSWVPLNLRWSLMLLRGSRYVNIEDFGLKHHIHDGLWDILPNDQYGYIGNTGPTNCNC